MCIYIYIYMYTCTYIYIYICTCISPEGGPMGAASPDAPGAPRHKGYRYVTTCYGVSMVAEQGHVRQSWMSRVKQPMLRPSRNVTT